MACFKFKFQEDGFEYQGTTALEVDDFEDQDSASEMDEHKWMFAKIEPENNDPAESAPEEGGEVGA